MSAFHAMWSLGAGTGALLGAGAVRAGMAPGGHFLAVALVFGAMSLGLALIGWESRRGAPGPGFALPSGALMLAGLAAFCASIG